MNMITINEKDIIFAILREGKSFKTMMYDEKGESHLRDVIASQFAMLCVQYPMFEDILRAVVELLDTDRKAIIKVLEGFDTKTQVEIG